ncbi:MAG TPA: heavy metal sensor histidine kinase [Rheinheimera sp.]|uniref:heavy metal sensor histidine kinase n=1 Tax=Rheinheimera sp. TaxID=1869214 RepID=UPI002F934316
MHNAGTRPLSITVRVVIFVALTISICLFFVQQLLLSSVEHHFIEQDADELAVILHAVEHTLTAGQNGQQQPTQTLAKAVSGHHGVYYQVMDSQNRLVYRNADIDLSLLAANTPANTDYNAKAIHNWQLDGKAYRGVFSRLTTTDQQYQVIAAIDISFHEHFLQQLQRSLGLILLGSALLTLLAAWLAVHQGLNPLRGLSAQMRDIQTSKLDIRLSPAKVPAELRHMVQSFNHMLHRLEEGFTKLSHFSADIAHELRTPLTNMITQTQVSLSRARSADEYQNLLFSNLEELERLNKMISDMLWLAKSQNGLLTLQKQTLNLADEIQAIFDFFEALAEESGVRLSFSGPAILVQADRTLLRHALTNLLSNALRYTAQSQNITVTTALASPDSITISVENPGLPIPPEHLPYLFERFYRADQSRQRHSEGAGLGLAITKAIVEAHEGQINVESDLESTRFVIRLKTA